MNLNQMKDDVAKGVKLLDEHKPDWFETINTASLDIENGYNCVLG